MRRSCVGPRSGLRKLVTRSSNVIMPTRSPYACATQASISAALTAWSSLSSSPAGAVMRRPQSSAMITCCPRSASTPTTPGSPHLQVDGAELVRAASRRARRVGELEHAAAVEPSGDLARRRSQRIRRVVGDPGQETSRGAVLDDDGDLFGLAEREGLWHHAP